MNGYASYACPEPIPYECVDCGAEFTPTDEQLAEIKDGAFPQCSECEPSREAHHIDCVCLDCNAPDLPIADNN